MLTATTTSAANLTLAQLAAIAGVDPSELRDERDIEEACELAKARMAEVAKREALEAKAREAEEAKVREALEAQERVEEAKRVKARLTATEGALEAIRGLGAKVFGGDYVAAAVERIDALWAVGGWSFSGNQGKDALMVHETGATFTLDGAGIGDLPAPRSVWEHVASVLHRARMDAGYSAVKELGGRGRDPQPLIEALVKLGFERVEDEPGKFGGMDAVFIDPRDPRLLTLDIKEGAVQVSSIPVFHGGEGDKEVREREVAELNVKADEERAQAEIEARVRKGRKALSLAKSAMGDNALGKDQVEAAVKALQAEGWFPRRSVIGGRDREFYHPDGGVIEVFGAGDSRIDHGVLKFAPIPGLSAGVFSPPVAKQAPRPEPGNVVEGKVAPSRRPATGKKRMSKAEYAAKEAAKIRATEQAAAKAEADALKAKEAKKSKKAKDVDAPADKGK